MTIACENRTSNKSVVGFKKFRLFKVHKLLLCISSPYFKEMLADNPCPHPIVMIREAQAEDIEAILKFIYTGQVGFSNLYFRDESRAENNRDLGWKALLIYFLTVKL